MKKLLTSFVVMLFLASEGLHAQSTVIEEISTVKDNPTVFGIGLKGSYLYVNPGMSSVKIYNISDPAHPVSAGSVSYTGGFAQHLDVFGNYLYVYGGTLNNLVIFDITNPTAPIELGRLALPSSPSGSGHLPNYSYLTSSNTMYVINTTNKSAPYIQNQITYPAGTYGMRSIYVNTEVIYIGITNGFLIYNNATPSLPVFVSNVTNGSLNLSVDATNNKLYICYGAAGQYRHNILEISDKFNPIQIYQGYGGSSAYGKVLYHNGMLIQEGAQSSGQQPVSLYRVLSDTTSFIMDFLGSVNFSITDMDAFGTYFIVAKNGGIQILKYTFVVDVKEHDSRKIMKVFPNPAAVKTNIDFYLKDAANTKLEIYNINGQLIKTMVDAHCSNGQQTVVWDLTDNAGNKAANGIYICKIVSGNYISANKIFVER